MKKLFVTIMAVIAVSAYVSAQTATSSTDATKATQTVNAADMQKDASQCDVKATECTTTGKSCCSGHNREEMNSASASSTTGAELSKSAESCHQVSFGMSAEKPKKEEKTENPQ